MTNFKFTIPTLGVVTAGHVHAGVNSITESKIILKLMHVYCLISDNSATCSYYITKCNLSNINNLGILMYY